MLKLIPRLIPIAALIFGVACGQDTGQEAVAEQAASETDDVTIAECTSDAAGMVANVAITNNSSKRSSYVIDVAFESPDGTTQHATGLTFVNGVEPGQQATSQAHSLTAPPAAPGQFTCRLVEVDRMSDVG